MKLKILVLLLSAATLNAMELPEAQAGIEHLPTEIHAQILLNLANADTAKEAIKNILSFTQINKTFAPFLDDEYISKLLIEKLAEKYYNNNQLKAAQELNTKGARLWLATYLAQEKQNKQEAIIPLFAALYANDAKAVINLINAGMDANTRDKKLGKTPLMVAAQNGDLILMDFLISKGAAIDSSDKHGTTPLMYGIRNGKIDAVKFLLEKGALIDAQNASGFTPLMWAIHRKQPEIAQLLIDKNANISLTDTQGTSALMEAAAHNLPQIAQLLISKGVDVNAVSKDGYSALIDAAFEKNPELVSLLLKAGANPSQVTQQGITSLFAAAENPETLKILLNTTARNLINNKTQLGWTALIGAAATGNLDTVKLLLQAGADPNIKDNYNFTALDYAFSTHRFESAPIINALLEAKADPNSNNGDDTVLLAVLRSLWNAPEETRDAAIEIVTNLLKHRTDPNYQNPTDGFTPLTLTAYTQFPIEPIIDALIKAGADVNKPTMSGATPLTLALPAGPLGTPRGHIANLKALLAHKDKLNIDAQDGVGFTALTSALSLGNIEAIKALLEAGANPNLPNYIGTTPLQLAESTYNAEIIELLKKYIREAEAQK